MKDGRWKYWYGYAMDKMTYEACMELMKLQEVIKIENVSSRRWRRLLNS